MGADISETKTPAPPVRTAFRARPNPAPPDAPAAAAQPAQGLRFTPMADAAGGDRDILMGYQVFLGRDPENSFVIAEAKSSPLRAFITGLILSGEFQAAVLQAMARRVPLPHERNATGPSADQLAWLATLLVLPEDVRTALAPPDAVLEWRAFWTTLTAMPGFPRGDEALAPAGPKVAAADAGDGFVLITIEQPKAGDKVQPGSMLNGAGWAIAPADIAEVTVLLDETELAPARYGLPRPDVARNFPHYRHVDHCGFAFAVQVPAGAVITANSQLNVVVRTLTGQTGKRGVRIAPPAPAAGQSAWPLRLAVEDARVDAGGYLRLRGWALSRAGIASIAVYLGEARLGEADHGLDRPAIAAQHPDYPDAGRSGFVFGASLTGRVRDTASIRVQVTDKAGDRRQVIVPVQMPVAGRPAAPAGRIAPAAPQVTMDAPAGVAHPAGRFRCERAEIGERGLIVISGWALPESGVRDLAVLHAGRVIAMAICHGRRDDIARLFPDAPAADRAGFRSAFQPQTPLRPGDVLTLRLRAGSGETQTLDVTLAASGPRKPAARPVAEVASVAPTRLEIDQPGLEGDVAPAPVRGALTISGWAVAGPGIAEVTLACDGRPLGPAYLGERREDLARTFPDCLDALRGGFAMVLPPGALAAGTRTITVRARSRGGDEQSTSFRVTIDPADERRPGSAPRVSMPRAEQAFLTALLASRDCTPVFSVAIRQPAGATAEDVRATLASLARQAYGSFILLGSAPVVAAAAGFAALAGRVADPAAPGRTPRKKSRAKAAAQAGATPAEACATGPSRPGLVMVLEAGDVLGCDGLLALAAAYATDRDAQVIYADERRHDPARGRSAVFHKPDWSPELLLNMDYIGRPWCASQAAMDQAGLTLADLLAQPSYATLLRLTEAAGRVIHLNKVLAETTGPTLAEQALPAVLAAAARRGEPATVIPGAVPGTWRLRRVTPFPGLVSIIIPTAGKAGLVRKAIDSIRRTTDSAMVEIVVLDNVPAADRDTKAWLRANADQVLAVPGPFNWSAFNNQAAAAADGDMLLFLNDDVEARSPGWLEAMLEHAMRPSVGVVGARLLYPDGKVQHGGVYLSETAGRHAFRFAAGNDPGPFGLAVVTRETAAVTGACQLVSRRVFDQLGGFDIAHDVINNDVDFCLRAHAAGLAVIVTPHAELMHHELASRAGIEDRHDSAQFLRDWRLTLLRGDPFHSRRLLADFDQYEPDQEPVLAIHAGPRGPQAGAIRHILAVKLDHIGDFLTALPAFRALKARFPAARVTALVPPASAVLARQEASIDEVLEFTFFHQRSAEGLLGVTEQDYDALAARLAPYGFDMAIDLRMHPETRLVLRHSGAPFLVGYDREGRFPWLHVRPEWEADERLRPKSAHISERLLSLVEAAAQACREWPVAAVPPARDPATVPALAQLPAAFRAKRLVCLHPGVGNPMRRWQAANFAALIDLLAEADDMHAVLIGGADEQATARAVLDAVVAQDRVVSLVGSLALAELADVLQACALFVGNDSGPKHLAASLGVPTLGIHAAVVDAQEWAPLGPAAMALERQVVCSPCYLAYESECPRGMACLTGIKPRDALAACRRLLAMRPEAASTVARGKIRQRS
jgi:ADP-heptose:LPS heptosyltransferase/GT2 family glycosyltransferase